MKTTDINEDQELQDFFAEMKAKDQTMELPVFFKVNKTRIWQLIPIGIAASLALGFMFWQQEETIQNPPAEVIIITLEKDENNKQQILIEEKTYLETWESPTASLLTEY